MNILLHICCGPCSLMPIKHWQALGHKLSGFFYNPNIHPATEFMKRREAALTVANLYGLSMLELLPRYDLGAWLKAVHQDDPLSPQRCNYCYISRLEECAKMAKANGFEAFTSSLLYSRYQNHDLIKFHGQNLAQKYELQFLYADLRIDWQAGIDLSKEMALYRQNYCGCIYSEAERFNKKVNK